MMFSLTAGFAYAVPDRTGKLDIGVNISAALPTDNDVEDTYYIGGSWAYGIYEWLAIGFEAGWIDSDTNMDIDASSITAGDITGVPVFGDFIFRLPMADQPINPYAVLGLGGIFWSLEEDDAITNAGFEADVNSSFAMKFGGGVDWFVTPNWIIYFEGAYVWTNEDVTIRSSDGSERVTDENSLDFWTVGGGIKYLFA